MSSLFYSFFPDSICILFVNGISIFDHLRQFEPKFMGPFKVSSSVLSLFEDNSVSFLQDIMNPPVGSWFILDALCYDMFGNLDWVQLLEIG